MFDNSKKDCHEFSLQSIYYPNHFIGDFNDIDKVCHSQCLTLNLQTHLYKIQNFLDLLAILLKQFKYVLHIFTDIQGQNPKSPKI